MTLEEPSILYIGEKELNGCKITKYKDFNSIDCKFDIAIFDNVKSDIIIRRLRQENPRLVAVFINPENVVVEDSRERRNYFTLSEEKNERSEEKSERHEGIKKILGQYGFKFENLK